MVLERAHDVGANVAASTRRTSTPLISTPKRGWADWLVSRAMLPVLPVARHFLSARSSYGAEYG